MRKGSHFYCRLALVGFIIVSISGAQVAHAHSYHVDHTDEELAMMDTESLLHVEHDLRQQNKLVDKHVASIHGKLTHIGEKQKELSKEFMKLESGRDWEGRQKLNKEKELGVAKAEMQTKRDQMATLSAHAEEVRKRIRELEEKLQSLSLQKQADELRFENPTILDVVDAKVDQLPPTAQQVLNKTLHTLIFPGLSSGAASAEQLRRHMRGSTQHVAIASAFTIYAFIIGLIVVVFRAYKQITGKVTLTKIIFTGDMCFAAFWFFITTWSVGLLDDPLLVMRRQNEPILIAVQLTVGCAVLVYISIRCISLAATLRSTEAVELVFALFIVQHYYQSVWAPSLTDGNGSAGSGTYLSYSLGHLMLAARRARSQVLGVEQHRYTPNKLDGEGSGGFDDEGGETGGVGWFVAQMRHVALLLEAVLFTVTPKAITEEESEFPPDRDPSPSRPGRSETTSHRKSKKRRDRSRHRAVKERVYLEG